MKMIRHIFSYCMILFIISCSQTSDIPKRNSDESKDATETNEMVEQEIRLNVNSVYCWVDMMPNSDGRFHITGELELIKNVKHDIAFTKLKSVKVFQRNQNIYIINPVVQTDDHPDGENITIRFSTVRGLVVNAGLAIEKPISIELIFEEGSEEYSYFIDNIKIQETH